MSRTRRRVLSWVGTLIVIGGLGAGLRWLPGGSGPAGELAWLLTQRGHNPPPRRATGILLNLLETAPERVPEVFAALGRDDDPRVVQGLNWLLADAITLDARNDYGIGAELRSIYHAQMAAGNVPASDRVAAVLRELQATPAGSQPCVP
jgi:hypothetical protein